jgi:O-antigen ligase
MNEPTANPSDAARDPAGLRDALPALPLACWLAAFWFLSGDVWHRDILGWLVIPSLLLVPRARLREIPRFRWLAAAAVLLGWQTLSRLWSAGANSPPGWWLDSLLVFGLLCALLAHAPGRAICGWVFPLLSLVSATVSAISLAAFYLPGAHDLADDRLRNVFFHQDGLNAVPTGFLFAFGAIVAAWLTTRAPRRDMRILHLWAAAFSVFGLLATQSRGPMLMFVVGFLALLAFERKRTLPVLAAIASIALVYFALLLWISGGRDAALDLVQRGGTGRFDIYRWYLSHMSVREFLIGTGMARSPELPEEAIGWLVHHPHSIYLTQLYQTGIVGAALLLALIAGAAGAAWALARRGDSLWLCLLAGACVALLFDGAQVLTVYSIVRIEILLVVVPAAIAVGRAPRGGKGSEK